MAKKKKTALDPASFLTLPEVTGAVATARALMASGKEVSDIVDDTGNQYIDLVMEGGGVLGIALVGYTYLLESAGIRFLGIGGTSAGAINATLLAGLGPPAEAKSERLLTALCAKDLYEFVDGDDDARDFVDALVQDKGTVTKALKLLQVLDNLNERLGLNPGENFRSWISDLLSAAGVSTVAQLSARMNTLPAGLRYRDGTQLDVAKAAARLAIVTADVTTETKVVFPEMADLYYSSPEQVNPADLVRASMSIPYFFEPVRRTNVPRSEHLIARWDKCAGIKFSSVDGIPEEIHLVDGGIMSNFPIALFHDTKAKPPAPTFGARLGLTRRRNRIEGPVQLFEAVFNSARHVLDFDFIAKNPDYRLLVKEIPVDDFNWLDFHMPAGEQQKLFAIGVKAAADFLVGFDWGHYKDLRAELLPAMALAGPAPGGA